RQKAQQGLERQEERAEAVLRQALGAPLSLEARRRVERLLGRLEGLRTSAERLKVERAVRVLEAAGSAEVRAGLRRLAGGAPEAWTTREAQEALGRLAKRP